MKTAFKNFQPKLLTEAFYGIIHVEDLPIEEFIRTIKNIHSFEAVQKLDGANLRAGLDTDGKLYTSREQKGGKRFYDISDFPEKSSFDGFKAAHAVVMKNDIAFKQCLTPGQEINLEVIYGSQPNTVFYGKDNLNYIGLLELLPGDDPSIEPNQKKLRELYAQLKDKITTVKTIASDTFDGETSARAPRITDWKFAVSDKVPNEQIDELDFSADIRKLEKFLDTANETAEAIGLDLTNFEVLKDKSRDLADERKALDDRIRDEFKMPIKQKLQELIPKQKPSLRGDVDSDGAYDGIEGLIFTDPKTREKFKVVDREIFTKVNQFNYSVRNSITGKIVSTDTNLPIEARGGITGEAKLRAIRLLGLPDAEIPSQTKNALEPFKGETKEDTISNICDTLQQLNFTAIKKKIQAIYVNALDDVEDALDAFKMKADEYELELPDGQKIKYTKEIKRRTMMSFADTKQGIYEMLNKIKKADDLPDLIELFFHSQLKQLHGDSK